MSELYTCQQVAEMCSVKVGTVWGWVRDGKLKAVNLPKGYRITKDAVDELLAYGKEHKEK